MSISRLLSVNSEVSRERDAFFITFKPAGGASSTGSARSASPPRCPASTPAPYVREVRARAGAIYSPRLIDGNVTRLENLARRARGGASSGWSRGSPATPAPARSTSSSRSCGARGSSSSGSTSRATPRRSNRVVRRQFDTVEGDPFNPRAVRAAADRIRALGFFRDVAVDAREGLRGRPGADRRRRRGAGDRLALILRGGGVFGGIGVRPLARVQRAQLPGPGPDGGVLHLDHLGQQQQLPHLLRACAARPATWGSALAPSTGPPTASTPISTPRRAASRPRSTSRRGSTAGSRCATRSGSRTSTWTTTMTTMTTTCRRRRPCSPRRIGGSEIESAVGYTLSYDTRGTGLNPDAGVFLSFGQDFAGLGGDAQFVRSRRPPRRRRGCRAAISSSRPSSRAG